MSQKFNNFISNLEIERINHHYSQEHWARLLSMSLSSYKRLVSGATRKIDFELLPKVYDITGKTMYEMCGYQSELQELAAKIRGLSKEQLRFVSEIIDFELRYGNDVSVICPTGNMTDGMVYDSCTIYKLSLDQASAKYKNKINFGIKITSNHLSPAYHDGDILLMSCVPPRDGDIGIFVNVAEQRAYIRKFKQGSPCELLPITPYGETIYVDPKDHEEIQKWIKLGIVITKVRY